jgi:uncharacterized protein (TIGR02598 family)
MKTRTSRKAGFSLIEIVVALGVISFALVAILGVLPLGLKSGRNSAQETRANHLAEQIFATLSTQPFTSANLSSLGSNSTPIDLSLENTPAGSTGVTLYANYDGQFVAAKDSLTIELRFRNAPDGIVTGRASEVRVQISSRESNAQRMDYVSIIAAH